ncbi:MAG TPA: ATP-binding protein [Solirubrobacterales bacterium]|nr:ATP-binding protein [Solirubrobacterales bacterium]
MSIGGIPVLLLALTPARPFFWPLLAGVGATLAAALREARRRTVLNERLHELRRPLQALALSVPAAPPGVGEGPVEMAAVALARLEREINGEGDPEARSMVPMRPLLAAARRRWAGQAALSGATIALRRDIDEPVVEGDRLDLAAALDNLIVNALEHGGPRIELAADLVGDRVCLAVVDSGGGAGRRARERDALLRGRAGRRPRDLRPPFGRLTGRARHGHGLRLVRRTAVRHGGSFALHRGERGTSAVLELPPAARREAR